MKRFILRTDPIRSNCIRYISELATDRDKPLAVEIKPFIKNRSQAQNDFLHAVTLRILSDETGETIENLKEYLLGEAFGWDAVVYLNNREVHRPVKRNTSTLNVKEFSWFIEWCESWAATTLGITIPRPGEDVTGLRT